MNSEQHIRLLFKKYLANDCSASEAAELIDMIRSGENKVLIENLISQHLGNYAADESLYKAASEQLFKKLDLSAGSEEILIAPHRKPMYLKIAAAIVVMLAAYTTFYFLKSTAANRSTVITVPQDDVLPGGNKAILVLSDGHQVELNEMQVGKNIAEEEGVIIKKSADGQLAYHSGNNHKPGGLNTVKTPKGGQFQVILPDGSKVWLNAASSVTYPAVFNASERRVILTGEGYFEVATVMRNNKKVPFIVESGKQKIEVLGTRFNVNAYDDETGIKTTLIEGKVKVVTENETVILKPSQEFNLRAEGISTKKVDVEPVIDWKNGDFIFADEDIKSIMRKIGRWYNVELVYESEIPNENLSGQISRSRNLSDVLRMLELSGDTKFRIINNTIHISYSKK
ncbi:MAG: FecR family protein [Chitinophagaceae bacterium]|nr:FecR family protein [Chitinophagaceae bacterium]